MAGWHLADGTLIADSKTAIDVDIACTALTNTLPIRRLHLSEGQSTEIDVLYVPVSTTVPGVVRQRYSRHGDCYLYENLSSRFQVKLTVDSAGWVTDYPGVCHKVEQDE